ncbi:hypothetical protein TNCT_463901 [Trichonephila clavata]|uniref:Uncharacterized protein n=1 Tax=Trichonephila clavata TaxID=2740835 RepID=A0A8X6HK40_TRICU|nr:hypothetical protein TNCT_463901 [Trichonephila clavata]
MYPFWRTTIGDCATLKCQPFDHHPFGEGFFVCGRVRCRLFLILELKKTRENRSLCLQARRYQMSPARQLAVGVEVSSGIVIFRQTTCSHLHSRRPSVRISLTSSHRRSQLQWVVDHIHWRPEQWTNVLSTDEY